MGSRGVPECYPEEGNRLRPVDNSRGRVTYQRGKVEPAPGAVNEAHNFRSKQVSMILANPCPQFESKICLKHETSLV